MEAAEEEWGEEGQDEKIKRGERQEEKSKWTTREMVDKEGGEEKVHRGEEELV